MQNIKKIGESIEVTCPVTDKTKMFIITGRNWSFDKFESYMVGYTPYGRCIATVNKNCVAQMRIG